MNENEPLGKQTDSQMSEKQIAALIRKHNDNSVWIIKQNRELRKKLPNRYVAVRNGEIVRDSPNLKDLLKLLREEYGDISDITIDYITEKPLKLLL